MAERKGTVEELSYSTSDYVNDNGAGTNNAYVYLPYGYTPELKYNILYLVHCHYGDSSTFLSVENGLMRNVLDHMIVQGDIDPMIVVTAIYNYGSATANYIDAGLYCRALSFLFPHTAMTAVRSISAKTSSEQTFFQPYG